MKRFRAGCGRECDGPDDLKDLAYVGPAYPDCPGCEHHIEPVDGPPFCRWIDVNASLPFAELANLDTPTGKV